MDEVFQTPPFSALSRFLLWSSLIEVGKSVCGVCDDSDDYGIEILSETNKTDVHSSCAHFGRGRKRPTGYCGQNGRDASVEETTTAKIFQFRLGNIIFALGTFFPTPRCRSDV